MKAFGKHYETIWLKPGDDSAVQIIDQRYLPFKFVIEDLKTVDDVYIAIKDMHLRGAPLIGAAAAFGMYLAVLNYPGSNDDFETWIKEKAEFLKSSRPTAINLFHALNYMINELIPQRKHKNLQSSALQAALKFVDTERECSYNIGVNGLPLIENIASKKNRDVVNILTHCNAGWLACIDYGTATAPIYLAHEKGIKVHVWVDETRPRNQGARLTAWELGQHGVPYTLIPDNAGGHLMQHGMVDMVIVGSDRTTITGDVANKIGTYLKALAAWDNKIPFYVALPSTTFDWSIQDGINEIPIEQRNGDEVLYMEGMLNNDTIETFRIAPEDCKTINYGFDVTPARFITGLITEKGLCQANKESILHLFPERK